MTKHNRSLPLSALLRPLQAALSGDLDPRPDPPEPPPPGAASAVRRALRLIQQHVRTLGARRLPMAQRRGFGGLIVPRSTELVQRVVHCLRYDPGAFPDLSQSADKIDAWQDCADAWREAGCHFRALAALADQNYIYTQAGAIRAARGILERVEFTVAHAADFPHLDAVRRAAAMNPAWAVAQEILASCTPTAARARPRAPVPLTPRKRAARTERRALIRRRVEAIFKAYLARPVDPPLQAPRDALSVAANDGPV